MRILNDISSLQTTNNGNQSLILSQILSRSQPSRKKSTLAINPEFLKQNQIAEKWKGNSPVIFEFEGDAEVEELD